MASVGAPAPSRPKPTPARSPDDREARMSGNDLAGALAQPAVNLVERGRNLIVSGGVGTSKLPVRLGVPPEMVLVELG